MRFNSGRVRASFVPVAANGKDSGTEAADQSFDPKEIQVTSESPTTADSDSDAVDKSAQVGVQKVEATTSAWSKNQLILAYALYVHKRIEIGFWLML